MTDNSKEVPQYRLLQDSFFAPRLLFAGSIVATHAPPGNHMEPLNEAAKERMEEWYNEEFPVKDKDGKDTGEKYRPHMKYRIQKYEPGVHHPVQLLAEPVASDNTNSLSLAQVNQQHQKDTDQRPGPAVVPEAQAIKEQTGADVVEAAPNADPRKANIKVT